MPIYFVFCSICTIFDFVESTLARENPNKIWFSPRLFVPLQRKSTISIMKRTILSTILLCIGVMMMAQTPFGKGRMKVSKVARNAVRIQYTTDDAAKEDLPDWLYVKHDEVKSQDISTQIDAQGQTVTVKDKNGKPVFKATQHQLIDGQATLAFDSPEDEFLFGLGQFQDGYSNVRGLSRRLTQVNTQISMPMLLSSKGYGVLWNNYGMTEFNT